MSTSLAVCLVSARRPRLAMAVDAARASTAVSMCPTLYQGSAILGKLAAASSGPSRVHAVAPTRCPSSSRAFSTSRPVQAQPDFYSVLGVTRNASQTDIKRQFYQLSKKYHPDVNRDDENAKRKFQEVSEAYATLGHERTRRAYDANRLSPSTSASSAYSGYGGTSSMNAERRARAAYAWDYTRRRADSTRASRSRSSADGASAARPGFTAYGRGGVERESSFGFNDEHPADRLERLAERERRRRARAGTGDVEGPHGTGASSQRAHESELGNAVFRFAQGTTIFLVVLWLGTAGMRFLGLGHRGGPSGTSEERLRRA